MKFPKEVNEDASDSKKGYQKRIGINERKILDEEKERSCNKFEENCNLPTALVPPWIRNSLGLNEKTKTALKITNQKVFKGITESNIPKLGESDIKIYSNGDLIESNVYSQDHSSDNPCGEVNSSRNSGKIPSLWRNKTTRQNHCDCNVFRQSCKCRSNGRILKGENTSLNLMTLIDEHSLPEKEKHKSKNQKLKSRILKKNSYADQKYEKISKIGSREGLHSCSKNDEFVPSVSLKDDKYDLLLYEKSETVGLSEDFFLLKEIKNHASNKDCEKLSSSKKRIIADSVGLSKELDFGRDSKDDLERMEGFERAKNEVPRLSKTESENERSISAQTAQVEIDSKNKDGNGERKYCDESRKHYDRKKSSQQKLMKYPEEAKYEKQTDFEGETENEKMLQSKIREVPYKYKDSLFMDSSAEKMNEDPQFKTTFIEKVVSDILQKFTDLYRFQITPDSIRNIKNNIIHMIENELQESEDRKNNEEIDNTFFTLQESFKNQNESNIDSSNVKEREDKVLENFRKTVDATLTSKKGSLIPSPRVVGQNLLLKLSADNSEDKKHLCKHLLDNTKEKKIGRENDIMENENIKDLQKEFEKCLNLIQAQLDITGTKLCSIVLEKIEAEDVANKKVKIIHNNTKGITEAIKIYNERTLNLSEGDGTSIRTSKCPRLNISESCKLKCSQACQTVEKTFIVNSTQTDLSVIVVAEENNESFLRESNDFLNESDAEQLLESLEMAMEACYPESRNRNISAESCISIGSKIEKDKENILKSASRETSVSEKNLSFNADYENGKLHRKIKSYCDGLNYLEAEREKCSKNYPLDLYKCTNLNFDLASTDSAEAEKKISENEKVCIEVKTEEAKPQKQEEKQSGNILYWNGKQMDSGTDLKVHVENLIREKIKEIFEEEKFMEQKDVGVKTITGKIENDGFETAEGCRNIAERSSEKNSDTEKGCLLFSFSENDVINSLPHFDCTSCDEKMKSASNEAKVPGENDGQDTQSDGNKKKSVHDVGIQSSSHSLMPPNTLSAKPKSRLCTVSKVKKHKIRKEFYEPVVTNPGEKQKGIYVKTKSFSGSENKTNKFKLEFRNGDKSDRETKQETLGFTPADHSSTSNDSSGDGYGDGEPVCVKLIGIELMKEKGRSPSEGGGFENFKANESGKFTMEDLPKIENQRTKESSFSVLKGHKHWELIENLLNRVDRNEKDELWHDVKQFVRGKIDRDLSEHGTQEICIELEQDIPKYKKGKCSSTVVGKGNYRKKEGDLEVEVDLTLEDLERIVRHRDKNLRRRRYQKRKIKPDIKGSSNSSVTSAGIPSYCGLRYYGKSGNMHRSESVIPSDTTK